jgi:hypothetical protein
MYVCACVCVRVCVGGGCGRRWACTRDHRERLLRPFAVFQSSVVPARVALAECIVHDDYPLAQAHMVLVGTELCRGTGHVTTLSCQTGTGEEVWATRLPIQASSLVGTRDVVIVGCEDGSLVILCALSGRLLQAPLGTYCCVPLFSPSEAPSFVWPCVETVRVSLVVTTYWTVFLHGVCAVP